MGTVVKGEVVITPFPYSDLSASKKRPAVVLAAFPDSGVVLLAQVTSREIIDGFAVELGSDDFQSGGLRADSYIRLNYLFTCDTASVFYAAGELKKPKLDQVIAKLIEMLSRD